MEENEDCEVCLLRQYCVQAICYFDYNRCENCPSEKDCDGDSCYYDIPCLKCGEPFNPVGHDGNVYFTCEGCNNEFWAKWSKLPEIKFNQFTEEHIKIIKEYHKEDYFKLNCNHK